MMYVYLIVCIELGLFSGYNLTILLRFFGMFLILFYTCNLRANLTTPQYEEPLESFQAVIDLGEIVYIPTDIAATN